jgi:formate-nitrite transporter family protein
MGAPQKPNPERAAEEQSGELSAPPDTASNAATITESEAEKIEERSSPRTPDIYEAVRRLGEEEMVWPGHLVMVVRSGGRLSISFSLLSRSILNLHLPDTKWRRLISGFGYSMGFVMVVLARRQLFTEDTVTVVLPVMAQLTLENLGKLARMWGICVAGSTEAFMQVANGETELWRIA